MACSLLFVVIAADRPSLFAATTHTGFFPRWMAGPLGGLWPGLTRDGTALRWVFTAGMVTMYVCYLLALTYVPRMRSSARWAIATVVAVHAILFLAPPLALTDIFNYINYGRMEVVHHLNPYTTYPILEPHSDPATCSRTGISCSARTAPCSRCSRSRWCRWAWPRRSGRSRRCSWL